MPFASCYRVKLVTKSLHIVAGVFEVGNHPIVEFFGPLSTPLDPHVLLRRHELVNDQVFESNFAGQLANTVHQVLSFAVDVLRNIV